MSRSIPQKQNCCTHIPQHKGSPFLSAPFISSCIICKRLPTISTFYMRLKVSHSTMPKNMLNNEMFFTLTIPPQRQLQQHLSTSIQSISKQLDHWNLASQQQPHNLSNKPPWTLMHNAISRVLPPLSPLRLSGDKTSHHGTQRGWTRDLSPHGKLPTRPTMTDIQPFWIHPKTNTNHGKTELLSHH